MTPNTKSADTRTVLRPYRSPISPAGNIAAASARVYEVTNHWSSDSDAFSDVARVGRARFRTVWSSPMAITDNTRAPSAHQRRAPSSFIADPTFHTQFGWQCLAYESVCQ